MDCSGRRAAADHGLAAHDLGPHAGMRAHKRFAARRGFRRAGCRIMARRGHGVPVFASTRRRSVFSSAW